MIITWALPRKGDHGDRHNGTKEEEDVGIVRDQGKDFTATLKRR